MKKHQSWGKIWKQFETQRSQEGHSLVKPKGIQDIEKHAGNKNDMIKSSGKTSLGFFARSSNGIQEVGMLVDGVGSKYDATQKECNHKDEHVGHGQARAKEFASNEIQKDGRELYEDR